MKKNYIGEISDLFKIPSSTLRYWEEESLIKFPRDKENNYRFPSLETILSIWDVAFYRELSIPLKEIKQIPSMGIDSLESMLIKNKDKLTDQLQTLKETIRKIEGKEENLKKIKFLKSNPYVIEKCIFEPIKLFNYSEDSLNKDMNQLYISNPDECIIVINQKRSFVDYGAFTSETCNDIFRPKDCSEKTYLKGLLKVDAINIKNTNSDELIENAIRLGYKPNIIIGQYLISAYDDKKYDYYEAWIELI